MSKEVLKSETFSDGSKLFLFKDSSLGKYDLGYFRIVYEVNGKKSGGGIFYRDNRSEAFKEFADQVKTLHTNIGKGL